MGKLEGPAAIHVGPTQESQAAHAALLALSFPLPDFVRAMLIAKARDVTSGKCSAADLLAPPTVP